MTDGMRRLQLAHELANASVKFVAVSLLHLETSLPKEQKPFGDEIAKLLPMVHDSWSPAKLDREVLPAAELWVAQAALVRVLGDFERYLGQAGGTPSKCGVAPEAEVGDESVDGWARPVRVARTRLGSGAVTFVESLCEVINWFYAVRNAIAHGSETADSLRKQQARTHWRKLDECFGFCGQVPQMPNVGSLTFGHVILASACSFKVANALDAIGQKEP